MLRNGRGYGGLTPKQTKRVPAFSVGMRFGFWRAAFAPGMNERIVMAGFRLDRISEEVRHALDAIIREMNDPRITGTYSVTRAEVTRDLRYAKVYISVLESDKADQMIKALKNAAGFIRHELGARVQLRCTPELLFYRDDNIAYGVHISELLKNVDMGSEEEEKAEGDE